MNAAERQRPPAGSLFLDHVGHFVADLEAAGKVLEDLGFFTTPVSHHVVDGKPGGTSNRCVMLQEGYLEILAPTHDTLNGRRVRGFMSRYDGVHLVCYGTPAAPAEQARLAAHGFSPDPTIELRRKIAGGKEVGFRVVYVPPEKMPECRAQYCEHLTPELVWSDHCKKHGNGALGLSAAYIVAEDVPAVAARWAEFSGLLPSREEELVRLETARGQVFIGSREEISKFIPDTPKAPAVAAVTLKFRDREAFAERCRKASMPLSQSARGYCVSLPKALGGSWLF